MTPLERAAPGTVLPDGSIKLAQPSPVYGQSIPSGRVFIERSQLSAAIAAGWSAYGDNTKSELVTVER